MAILLVASIVILGIWESLKKDNHQPVNTNGVKLICTNPEGGNPHSAAFRIQLPENFSGDVSAFSVDFADEKRGKKDKNVTPGLVFTHYYEVPGRYYPVLKYNSTPLDTAFVYLRTSRWTATAAMENDTIRVYPVNQFDVFKKRKISVTTTDLQRAGVDTTNTFYVHFVNTEPLNIDGDNFELAAHVTASQLRPGVRCSQVNIDVFGEKSKHRIIFMKPGCVSWSYLRVSEIIKDGEMDDLSSLGADFSEQGTIGLKVVNKHLTVFINEKPVYDISYNVALTRIYGIKIAFSGIGTIHDVQLKDLVTGETFNDGFDIANK